MAPSATSAAAASLIYAMEFRRQAGLRWDRPWVAFVATDPASQSGIRRYGIPMTAGEIAELDQRAADRDQVLAAINAYGVANPSTFAGTFVDQATGVTVAMFTDDIDQHQQALRSLLSPTVALQVVPVQWSLGQLEELKQRVSGGWLDDHGFDLFDLGVNLRENRVDLTVRSADPAAAEMIEEHFGAGAMLVVHREGAAASTAPKGTLTGRAVDSSGGPVAGLDVELTGSTPEATDRGDIGAETDAAGRFFFGDVVPSRYVVRLLSHFDASGNYLEGANRIEVGRGVAEVRGSEIATIEVVVETPR